ncbi:MAG: hypothetical protein IKH57_20120 [Clostridia bacterium]|nr:hypothetical protein [Clostridia bacterium]
MMMDDRLPVRSSFFSTGVTKREQAEEKAGNSSNRFDPAANCAVKGMISYPCCPKETVIVFLNAHGQVSIKCPRCGKFARFDYDRMAATAFRAYRGASQMYKPKR